MGRGQHIFRPVNKEDRHTCYFGFIGEGVHVGDVKSQWDDTRDPWVRSVSVAWQLAGGVLWRMWGWVWRNRPCSQRHPLCQGAIWRQSNRHLRVRWTLSPSGERSTVRDCRMYWILHSDSLDLFDLVRGLAAAVYLYMQICAACWCLPTECFLPPEPVVKIGCLTSEQEELHMNRRLFSQ